MDTKRQVRDDMRPNGAIVATLCDVSSRRAKGLEARIRAAVAAGSPDVRRLIQMLHGSYSVDSSTVHNVMPTVGRQQIAKALAQQLSTLAEVEANYGAVGTGTDTPLVGDTKLKTELFRTTLASQSYSGVIGYHVAFYAAGDFDDTVYEHGLFIDGTAAADSGVILSHALLNAPTGYYKGPTNTLTVEHVINLAV